MCQGEYITLEFGGVPANGTLSLGMGVVVGRAFNTRTPVFVEEMPHLIFRPHWNVPRSNRAPGGRADPPTRPRPKNSLGSVKFVFPNDDNVYPHGTPALQLFSRSRRDFSHGCVRVEDPVALAARALKISTGVDAGADSGCDARESTASGEPAEAHPGDSVLRHRGGGECDALRRRHLRPRREAGSRPRTPAPVVGGRRTIAGDHLEGPRAFREVGQVMEQIEQPGIDGRTSPVRKSRRK